MTFTVTRTRDSEASQTIDFATSIGGGDNAEVGDFAAGSGTLTFAAGDLTRTFTVQTAIDAIYEGGETFTVTLTNNSAGSTISDATGVGTILDDGSGPGPFGPGPGCDDDRPVFAINDITVNEAAGTMTFTVTKSGLTALASTVDYSMSDGSAIAGAGNDYTAASGTLNFAPGDNSKTITVPILNDIPPRFEGAENFNVTLAGASNATIADNLGVGTIKDDGTGPGGTDDDRPVLNIPSPTPTPIVTAPRSESISSPIVSPITVVPAFSRISFDPSLHVLAAVAESQQQQLQLAAVASGSIPEAGNLEVRSPAAQMAMDPSLYVLPAVAGARQDGQEVSTQIRARTGSSFSSPLLQAAFAGQPIIATVFDNPFSGESIDTPLSAPIPATQSIIPAPMPESSRPDPARPDDGTDDLELRLKSGRGSTGDAGPAPMLRAPLSYRSFNDQIRSTAQRMDTRQQAANLERALAARQLSVGRAA